MKKILTTVCGLMLLATATFAFESYKDSTILSSTDINACNPQGTATVAYRNWTLTDSRGFEYQTNSCAVGYHSNKSKDQFIQLQKWSAKDNYGYYSWLKLPEINYPIEEVTLTIGDNQADKGSAVAQNRYIYFIKENRPGKYAEESDTVSTNVIDQAEVTGLSTITLKADIPASTTGYIVVGHKGGFRIWDIKIKWTVDKELEATGVSLSQESITLGRDESQTLTVKFTPVNATTRNIEWSSLDETIATVDAEGKVTGVAAGTTKIIATVQGLDIKDTCEVEVRNSATSIDILLDGEPIDSLQLEADVEGSIFDTETLSIRFNPDGALVEEIIWKSTNPAVATVNASTGYIQAQSKGTTLIIAESESGLKDTCVVVCVGRAVPEKITINKHTLTLEKGAYELLTAVVEPANLPEGFDDVHWESKNEKVATVNYSKGTVIAQGAGTTWIVASTFNGIKDSCKVIVEGAPVSGEYYVKVLSEPESWVGKYLIVCEDENVAFNGGLSEYDVAKNTIHVEIDNSAIEATAKTNAASFDIATYNSEFSLKGNGGKFTGYNKEETQYKNNNGIQTSATALLNTIALDNEMNALIKGADGSQLMFNTDSSVPKQLLFRYYAHPESVVTLKPIQLYRYVGNQTGINQVAIEGVEYYNNAIHNSNNQVLNIYTIRGILVYQSDESTIDLTSFEKGVYVVKSTEGALKIVR